MDGGSGGRRGWGNEVKGLPSARKASGKDPAEHLRTVHFGLLADSHDATSAHTALQDLELRSFFRVLDQTKADVVTFHQEVPVRAFESKSRASLAESAELGNLLRRTAAAAETIFRDAAEEICRPLNEQLLGLINATDRVIYRRQSRFRSVQSVLGGLQRQHGA